MKKILVLSAALALIGSGVFAQGLTLSGNVKTGLGVTATTTNALDDDGGASSFFVDSDNIHGNNTQSLSGQYNLLAPSGGFYGAYGAPVGARLELNGAWTNDDATVGVNFRLRGDAETGKGSVNWAPNIRGAYGWVKLLDGVVRIDGGRYHDNLWGNSGVGRVIDGRGLEADLTGARFVISPIEGLSFGWVLGTTGGVLSNLGTYNVDSAAWIFANNVFGLRYKNDDLLGLNISAAYRMLTSTAANNFNTNESGGDELIFEVQIKPVDPLKIDLQGQIIGLGVQNRNAALDAPYLMGIGVGLGQVGTLTGDARDAFLADKADSYIPWKVGAQTALTFDATYDVNEGLSAGLMFQGIIADLGVPVSGTGATEDVFFAPVITPHVTVHFSPLFSVYAEVDYSITPSTKTGGAIWSQNKMKNDADADKLVNAGLATDRASALDSLRLLSMAPDLLEASTAGAVAALKAQGVGGAEAMQVVHGLTVVLQGIVHVGSNASVVIGDNITPLSYDTYTGKNIFSNKFYLDFVYNF